MKLNKILKNVFLVTVACIMLSACATKKSTGQMQMMFILEKTQLNI